MSRFCKPLDAHDLHDNEALSAAEQLEFKLLLEKQLVDLEERRKAAMDALRLPRQSVGDQVDLAALIELQDQALADQQRCARSEKFAPPWPVFEPGVMGFAKSPVNRSTGRD